MNDIPIFSNEEAVKPKLTFTNYKLDPSTLTLKDFGKLIVFRCGGISRFARMLGVTKGRASQIAHGFSLPESPDLIYKISGILSIDPITLTQLFERYRKNGEDDDGTHI